MLKPPLLAALALTAVGALLIGCSTSEPGIRNSMGTVRTTVAANPPQVAEAAEAVLRDLELIRVHSTSTDVDGEAFGYTASDKKVNVSIKQESENLSTLKVRVGAFGDEDLGVAVITRIEEQLGVMDK